MISIIIPIYNKQNCLHVSVESVLRQTNGDFELILIDDGSFDSSFELCKEYEKVDARIRAYSKSNGGVSSARNLGIQIARGEYLTFLDADDELAPNALELMLKGARNDAEIVSLGFDIVKNKVVVGSRIPPSLTINSKFDYQKAYYGLECASAFNSACAKLYKADFIKKNNILFNEKISILEDGSFVYACLDKANRVELIGKSIYNYIQAQGESLVSKYHANFTEAVEIEYSSSKWMVNYIDGIALDAFYAKRFNRIVGFICALCNQQIDKEQRLGLLKACLASDSVCEILKNVNKKRLTFKEKIKLDLLKKKRYTLIMAMFKK